VTLIGANGAGKTTLMRTISGLKRPTSGEIWFDDRRIDSEPPENIVRAGISHCPEGRRLFPNMSVRANLKLGAFSRKDKAGVTRDLAMVYEHFPILKERDNQCAGTLSGGEQQMLAIGRALLSMPRILLLDEPSLGLSPIMVQEIAKIIGNISKAGITIVLSEQNAHMALRLANKGYVMETGSIVLEDHAENLLDNKSVKRAYLGGD
jgi:branched-chain amino acid transport system ATP-binding protein